jgi:hypothetical protein
LSEAIAKSQSKGPRPPTGSLIVGWSAVLLATSAATFWSFWGAIEAFHEGWWKPLLWMRLLQLLAYLAPAAVLAGLTACSIRWPRLGAALFAMTGFVISALIVIDQATFSIDILLCITALPMTLGLMFLYGRTEPRSVALAVALGLPALMLLACGVEPAWRVSQRFDDGDRGSRLIAGQGVTLLWAPDGPGWSRMGNVPWQEAVQRASHLTADGASLADSPQNIWRLPTRAEVVHSLTRGNVNAGGTWDAAGERAAYVRKPDKESPLWDIYAPLIYLWTSEEADQRRAWVVVYHGGVFPKDKRMGSSSLGFRAVRNPPSEPGSAGPAD